MLSVQVASKDANPTGSVHKSRGDIVVCTVEQVLCVSVLQSGQYVCSRRFLHV